MKQKKRNQNYGRFLSVLEIHIRSELAFFLDPEQRTFNYSPNLGDVTNTRVRAGLDPIQIRSKRIGTVQQ
jgi:hypothetical protein